LRRKGEAPVRRGG